MGAVSMDCGLSCSRNQCCTVVYKRHGQLSSTSWFVADWPSCKRARLEVVITYNIAPFVTTKHLFIKRKVKFREVSLCVIERQEAGRQPVVS